MKLANGALIAFAAGSLFAAACSKKQEESKAMDKPMAAETKPEMKSGEMKSGEMKTDTAAEPAMATGEKTAKVHCGGVNACKGHGACKGEANACAGKNGCAGHGWVEMTEDECKAKNGKILATK